MQSSDHQDIDAVLVESVRGLLVRDRQKVAPSDRHSPQTLGHGIGLRTCA